MEISPTLLKRYKQIHLAIYGEELTDAEASRQAINLLKLMRLIYRPIPIESNKESNK